MVMPVASMIWALDGMVTEAAAPTAVILPFCITTAPFSITPWVMVRSLPPFRAMGFCWEEARVEKVRVKSKSKDKGEFKINFNSSGRGRPLHIWGWDDGWWLKVDECITLPPCSG